MKRMQITKGGRRPGFSKIPGGATGQLTKLWFVKSLQPFVIEIDDGASISDILILRGILRDHGVEASAITLSEGTPAEETVIGRILSSGEKFKEIDFGADTAEQDTNLRSYFIPTEAFRSVQNKDQTLVVGPKGTGKSAILATLVANVDSNYTVVITPERFHKALLKDILEKDTPIGSDIHAFSAAWMHTILTEVFKQVLNNRRGLRVGALAKIHNYIRDNSKDAELDLLSRFVAFCRRVEGIKVGSYDLSIKTQELESAYRLDTILALLPALKAAVEGRTFMVLIDELDQGWDNTPLANAFLQSLLVTALRLHGFQAGIRVTAFLRTEIFDILKKNFDQLDKMRENIQVLRWNRNALASLVGNRVAFAVNFAVKYLEEPDTVVKLLFRDAPVGFNGDGFDYILSRTSMRPREVLQFCRLAYKSAVDSGASRIHPRAVLEAEEEFSRWRFEHLWSEYLHIYPQLDTLLEGFRHSHRTLSYADAALVATETIINRLDAADAPSWLKDSSEHSVLSVLFNIGFLGFKDHLLADADPKQQATPEYVFFHNRPAARLREGIDLKIHPGFWRYLEIQ